MATNYLVTEQKYRSYTKKNKYCIHVVNVCITCKESPVLNQDEMGI